MSSIATSHSVLFRSSSRIVLRGLALLIGLLPIIEPGAWDCAPSLRLSAQTGSGFKEVAQEKSDMTQLKLGEGIEREMAGGQSHSYRITLAEGQFLSVVVDQRGIDVVVTLFSPDGPKLVEVDTDNGAHGPETIFWIIEATGDYQLKIRSMEKDAATGRYEVKIATLRTATEQDRALAEAFKFHNESAILRNNRMYAAAIPPAERALAILEKALEPDRPEIGDALCYLANLRMSIKDNAVAETLYLRGLSILEKSYGPDHRDFVSPLNNLGILYEAKGDHASARQSYLRALTIQENISGPEHPRVGAILYNLAIISQAEGDYFEAERLYQRALSIREKTLKPGDPNILATLNSLINLYRDEGDIARAEEIYLRALDILEKASGSESREFAATLNNFANFYRYKGDYTRAEQYSQRALDILEKAGRQEDPDFVATLNNLANVFLDKGDHTRAEQYYSRALDIRRKAVGSDHPEVAKLLGNLAIVYRHKGDYDKSEQSYLRALGILEKALGPDHPEVARTLNNLAILYRHKGDYASAEKRLLRALEIWEKSPTPDHPDSAHPLNSLASLYGRQGDYERAERYCRRALDIWKKTFGQYHPNIARALNNLSAIFEGKGEIGQAVAIQTLASDIEERYLTLNIVAGSERQKLAYLATFSAKSEINISLHVDSAPNDPAALRLALTIILQRKGRSLDAMTDSIAVLRRRANPQDQHLFDELRNTLSQLSRLIINGPQRSAPAEYQSRIKSLEERKEKLESEMSRLSDEFRAQSQAVTIAAVQSAIPSDAALVEFYSYRPFKAKGARPDEEFGKARYVAYILRHSGEPQWADLGEAAVIDSAVDAWREALRNPNSANVKRLARSLDEKIMRPVRKLAGDTRQLLLSPDGALNLIPFGALVDGQNRYLIESYSFTYLTSGRDLLRLQARAPSKQGPVVVANPQFDLSESAVAPGQTAGRETESRRSVDYMEKNFGLLPSTAIEARDIVAILPEAKALTGAQATEAAIKQLSGPSILHVATHGFFLADRKPKVTDTNFKSPEEIADYLEDPGLRSGLIFAGANQRRSGPGEDGVFTAMEAAGLDLWGTKLIVLSACETGVGVVKNGEGVYGLRRALALAGSESQVMSLWRVADKATRELMADYYRGLQRGEGRSEALRAVQLKMLKSSNRRHPFYWAGFIESGDWANLEGKR